MERGWGFFYNIFLIIIFLGWGGGLKQKQKQYARLLKRYIKTKWQ